jgi:hypothetical protein
LFPLCSFVIATFCCPCSFFSFFLSFYLSVCLSVCLSFFPSFFLFFFLSSTPENLVQTYQMAAWAVGDVEAIGKALHAQLEEKEPVTVTCVGCGGDLCAKCDAKNHSTLALPELAGNPHDFKSMFAIIFFYSPPPPPTHTRTHTICLNSIQLDAYMLFALFLLRQLALAVSGRRVPMARRTMLCRSRPKRARLPDTGRAWCPAPSVVTCARRATRPRRSTNRKVRRIFVWNIIVFFIIVSLFFFVLLLLLLLPYPCVLFCHPPFRVH